MRVGGGRCAGELSLWRPINFTIRRFKHQRPWYRLKTVQHPHGCIPGNRVGVHTVPPIPQPTVSCIVASEPFPQLVRFASHLPPPRILTTHGCFPCAPDQQREFGRSPTQTAVYPVRIPRLSHTILPILTILHQVQCILCRYLLPFMLPLLSQ